MPIRIGAAPQSDFHNPLGLLSDCHRRIERFLDVLLQVADQARGGRLDAAQRDAFDTALRYFRTGGPMHTADEEASLFPRLRAVPDERVREALDAVAALEADHRCVEQVHAEVDGLGRRWLHDGALSPDDAASLSRILHGLREDYRRHIAVEDTEVFPLAGQVLPAEQVEQVGREMASRRGVDPDGPPGLSRCASRRLERAKA